MPQKYKTPGVYPKEINISEITRPAGTSTAAMILRAQKGAINRVLTMTDDKKFIDTYGEPLYTSGIGSSSNDKKIPEYGYSAYAALEFLKESDDLKTIRIADASDKYATVKFGYKATQQPAASGDEYSVTSEGVSAGEVPTVLDTSTSIAALDAVNLSTTYSVMFGALGPAKENDIAVGIELFSSACDWRYQYDEYSSALSDMTVAKKVMKINVYTKLPTETWYANSSSTFNASAAYAYEAKEVFYATINQQLDGNKRSMQIEEVINGNSQYVYVKNNPSMLEFDIDNISHVNISGTLRKWLFGSLGGGLIQNVNHGLTSTDGYDFLKEKEDADYQILIVPTYDMTVKLKAMEVLNYRKNAIGVMQSGRYQDKTVDAILAQETYGYSAPSYTALYAGYDLINDQYNDRKVYIPKCIFGAALMARTDTVANVWDAPAGQRRGVIPSLDQNKVFTFAEIGLLYEKNINTSRAIQGLGHVMWGNKTAQLQKSALDRINVRRTLNWIETTVEESLNQYVLDINNTAAERLRVWTSVDKFLAGVKAQNGLTDYEVVCDDSNNDAQVIDSNQLNVDVYVQPVKTVEFISIQTIVTSTGVNFTEIRVR